MSETVQTGLTKLQNARTKSSKTIFNTLASLKIELDKVLQNDPVLEDRAKLISKFENASQLINDQLKIYHAHISKYSKILEKVFFFL